MQLKTHDFNGSEKILKEDLSTLWAELEAVLKALPIHLMASDQKGKVGTPIFDPKATNAAIKAALAVRGWPTNCPIPEEFQFLGTDVDYFHRGLLGEAQFSNYPFLLNNVVRSELLAKSKVQLGDGHVRVVVIVVKAHMFPASNSTLYYEQAVNQLTELAKHGVLDVPIRVVGLFADLGVSVPILWSSYSGRYARVPTKQEQCTGTLQPGKKASSRAKLVFTRQ